MPTGDLPSGAMSRTTRCHTQQRPAGLDGDSTAQSRSLDEGSSHPRPLQCPPRVCSRAQVTQGISEPVTNPTVSPDTQRIIPIPALPPHCVHPIQSYLFIHLCSSRDCSFFHPLPALSERMGRLLGRTQPGHRPAQLVQGRLHGDRGTPHAPGAGVPGHRTAPLRCSSLVPPGKASALRMPQAPPGQKPTRGWRRSRQSMGSARG